VVAPFAEACLARGPNISAGGGGLHLGTAQCPLSKFVRAKQLDLFGPNGAGKSTTLKLIAGTISPFSGNVRIRGRVAPLIEVGQGIHFELTGRENIFLNGAILGMSRSEIRRKFDDIVSFAGLESFLDTPVKRYSSGMKARLAMGVALHVDPDLFVSR
jgi:ABC-type polysaccharide/polyol phosphate transport system ATPase subunit